MNQESRRVVRDARGSGHWFPGEGRQLDAVVTAYIRQADVPSISGGIVAAIAPHAGYTYSGPVAGYAFRALRENAAHGWVPETVVVLGVNHRGGFRGVALMDGDAIRTPLGEAVLDKDAASILTGRSSRIRLEYTPHDGEHSAENEIPFVQVALPKARLVVGLFGEHDSRTVDDMVDALNELAKKKRIVVVASTDLLHHSDYDRVTRTDKITLGNIADLDTKALLASWSYSNQLCCGIGPVLAAMRFSESQGCTRGTVLRYRNSGDDFPASRGDYVVGYGAVVFTASGKASSE